MKIIEQEWLAFRRMVVPASAGPVQVEDVRRAFYSGAAVLFQAVVNKLSPGEEVQESDLAIFDSLNREIQEFAAEAIAGGGMRE